MRSLESVAAGGCDGCVEFVVFGMRVRSLESVAAGGSDGSVVFGMRVLVAEWRDCAGTGFCGVRDAGFLGGVSGLRSPDTWISGIRDVGFLGGVAGLRNPDTWISGARDAGVSGGTAQSGHVD